MIEEKNSQFLQTTKQKAKLYVNYKSFMTINGIIIWIFQPKQKTVNG